MKTATAEPGKIAELASSCGMTALWYRKSWKKWKSKSEKPTKSPLYREIFLCKIFFTKLLTSGGKCGIIGGPSTSARTEILFAFTPAIFLAEFL